MGDWSHKPDIAKGGEHLELYDDEICALEYPHRAFVLDSVVTQPAAGA